MKFASARKNRSSTLKYDSTHVFILPPNLPGKIDTFKITVQEVDSVPFVVLHKGLVLGSIRSKLKVGLSVYRTFAADKKKFTYVDADIGLCFFEMTPGSEVVADSNVVYYNAKTMSVRVILAAPSNTNEVHTTSQRNVIHELTTSVPTTGSYVMTVEPLKDDYVPHTWSAFTCRPDGAYNRSIVIVQSKAGSRRKTFAESKADYYHLRRHVLEMPTMAVESGTEMLEGHIYVRVEDGRPFISNKTTFK